MKQKMIYISDENFDKLKGENASALINDMITRHFQEVNHKSMTYEQKIQRIKELELKLEFEKKLEELKTS